MIRIQVGRTSGVEGFGAAALKELRPRAAAAVKKSLLVLESTAKQMLSRPGTGRTYRRSRTGPPHVASAPGEPPAVDFGRLRQSVTHEGPTWKGNSVRGEWGTNVEYAEGLEHGTSRMAARPWARPSEEQALPKVERILRSL